MIQDIAPHIYHNEYRPIPPTDESYLLCFEGDQVFLKSFDGELHFLKFQDVPTFPRTLSLDLIYLFSIDGDSFYLTRPDYLPDNDSFVRESTRIFRDGKPKWLAFAGITALQLSRWYESRRFCGHCGQALLHSTEERMLYCPDCKRMEYPKISPAVIVGILHNDKILMSKYAGRTTTHYALIAGFAEIGETIEDTVKREVYEEVGLHVKNLRYYKSQPWSFSDTLLFGFYAELDGDDSITLDTHELATAGWFSREEAPLQPLDISLTSEMIRKFKSGEISL